MIKLLLQIFLYIYSSYIFFCLILALCDILQIIPVGAADGIAFFILLPITFLTLIVLLLDLFILISIVIFKACKKDLHFPQIIDFLYYFKKHPFVASLRIFYYLFLVSVTIFLFKYTIN